MLRRPALLSGVLCFMLTGCAGGLSVSDRYGPSKLRADDGDIVISEVITQATANRVLGELARWNRPVVTLRLDSPGGDVASAMQIHDRLRRGDLRVATRVSDSAQCMSSCTLIYAAGDERLAGSRARFRFHAPAYVGKLPLPGPIVGLVETMARLGIANTYAEAAPEFARYLAEPGVEALHSREGLALSGAQLAARRDGFVTRLETH
jgi:hypothetical protein